MKPPYPLLFAFLFIAAIAGAVLLTRSCKPEPLQPIPVAKVLNADSLQSAIEAKYRNQELARIKADSARYENWKANYKPKAQNAATAVIRYRKQPTIANCDTAVQKLSEQVAELETGMAISDSIVSRQRNVITSFAGTVARKDSVIHQLGTGWQDAEARAENWERKAKRRGKIIGFGAAAVAAVVGGVMISK